MSKRAWVGLVFVVLTLNGVSGKVEAQAAKEGQTADKPVKEAVWQADPKVKRYLGRQYVLGGYAVSQPIGYTDHLVRKPGLLANYWQGQETASGFVPYLAMAFAPTPMPVNKSDKKMTPDRLLNIAMASLKRGFDDWTQTEFEHGQINGISFIRTYWTGTDRQQKRKLRGVSYVAIDDTAAISLTAQDVARTSTTNIPPNTADGLSTTPPPANDPPATNLPDKVDHLKLAETVFQTLHRVTP